MSDDVEVLRAIVSDLAKEYPERLMLLDHFAGVAMAAVIGRRAMWTEQRLREEMARMAYDVAEVMLKERNRRLGNG